MTIHASLGATATTLASLIDALKPHGNALLCFSYDGRTTAPGYHVTEVKRALLGSLDCGGNQESWSEVIIQLWDVDGDGNRMTVGKFLAIIRKVQREVGLEDGAPVIFEVGHDSAAMRIYAGRSVQVTNDGVVVVLAPRHASCKPRDRWLESEIAPRSGCCGAFSAGVACCE